MNRHDFDALLGRLRSPERIARLEIGRTADESLAGIQATSLLDVGAGSGLFTEVFVARGLAVNAVDLDPRMVQVARRFLPNVEFRVSSAEALPFRNDSFDLLFMGHVLHELERRKEVLQEAARVAKLRVVVLEYPTFPSDRGPSLSRRVQPDDLIAMATEVGFRSTEIIQLHEMVLYRLAVGEA